MVGKLMGMNAASAGLSVDKTEGMALRAKKADSPEAQKKAAEEFEAMLTEQMLKSMWSSVPKDGMISGSREEEYYRDMLNEAVAKDVSKGQGIGIKEVILRELKTKAAE